MHPRRVAPVAALLALTAGCGAAGFDIEIHEPLDVDQISAAALARGAEIRWVLPDVPVETLEPMVLTFVPANGDLSGALAFDASGTGLVATGLDVDVEYLVRLETIAGRLVSPTARVRPFPSGAIDPVPWYTTTDAVPSGGFGGSVTFADLDGDDFLEVAIGAPGIGTEISPLHGRVYVHPGATIFEGMPPYVIEGTEPFGMFGTTLAPSDDFDSDGYRDLLVHAPFPFQVSDTGANPAGVLHVIRGGEAAPFYGPAYTGVESDFFGASAIGRDFDGDDHADLLAGGPGQSYASVLSSSSGVLFTTTSSGGTSRLGFAVATGDFDGDGFADLAISEPLFGTATASEDTMGEPIFGGGEPEPPFDPDTDPQHYGRVRVYFADGLGGFETEFAALVGRTDGQMLGASIASADIDLDGIDDLLVGSTTCAIPGVANALTPGSISIWLGGGTDSVFTDSPQKVLTAQTLCLGRNVAAGDVNQDGRMDVIAGDSTAGPQGEGEVRAFLGGADGLPSSLSSAIPGLVPGASLGRSIAVGDLDGDGRSEVLVGAPGIGEQAGTAYLFRGAPRRGPAVELFTDTGASTLAVTGHFEPQEGPTVKYTCEWSFGDGVVEQEDCVPGVITNTHPYDAEGSYIVRLRVFSSDDRFGEAVARVQITGP